MSEIERQELNRPVPKIRAGDVTAQTLKAILGAIPFAGPALSEVVTDIIPNQRLDRIQAFAEAIGRRLDGFAEQVEDLDERLKSPVGCRHLEDCASMSTKSLSQERIEYIASLFVNGITRDKLDCEWNEMFVRLLSELSDCEIFSLAERTELSGCDDKIKEEYRAILVEPLLTAGSTKGDFERAAMQQGWLDHLDALGLAHEKGATELGVMLIEAIGPLQSVFEGRKEPIRHSTPRKRPTSDEMMMDLTRSLGVL